MTACLSLLVCLVLFYSGAHGACLDYTTKSSCSAENCEWAAISSGQCIFPSTLCTLPNCDRPGCVHTDAVLGQCTSPNCSSKAQSACNAASECEWTNTPATCAIPDTITCVDRGNETCNAGNNKRSCEFHSSQGVCLPPPESYCAAGYPAKWLLCEIDGNQGHASGCIQNGEGACVVDPDLICEYSEELYGCTESTRLAGCQASLVYGDCGPVSCNLTASKLRCDAASVDAGCEFKNVTGVCSVKNEIACNVAGDGSCDGASSSQCLNVSSKAEKCGPDPDLFCSASAGGDSCDTASDLAGCTWEDGAGVCVEKIQPKGSAQSVKASLGVALILTAALLLLI